MPKPSSRFVVPCASGARLTPSPHQPHAERYYVVLLTLLTVLLTSTHSNIDAEGDDDDDPPEIQDAAVCLRLEPVPPEQNRQPAKTSSSSRAG